MAQPAPREEAPTLTGADIWVAAATGDLSAARGADPTLRTEYGVCAIDVARETGHDEIAELLTRSCE